MCERKCTDDFSGWGKLNYTLRDGECPDQCPRCINDICKEMSLADGRRVRPSMRRNTKRGDMNQPPTKFSQHLWRKKVEKRADSYCPLSTPVYCSWEDGSSGCIPSWEKCDDDNSQTDYDRRMQQTGKWKINRMKEREIAGYGGHGMSRECVPFQEDKEFGHKCSAQSEKERERERAKREKIILSQRPCVCFWQVSDNGYILGGQEQSSESWRTRQYGPNTEYSQPEKMILMDKNTIIDNHKKILESFKTDKDKYKNISRYDLYISYVKCLQGSENDLKIIIDAVSKLSQVDDTLNVPGWLKDPSNSRYNCGNIVSLLEYRLFGNWRLPHITELSSIDNVGPNKAIGYVQQIILTPDYIEKFKGDEYMITCASTSGDCDCTTRESSCNVYIIHKPTVKAFINSNPDIFQTIPVKCSCDSENQRNIEDGIYDIVKYYMMNWRHESPPVPVPSYLKNADKNILDVERRKKEDFVGALFGNDSLLLRKNINYPYEFEGDRGTSLGINHKEGLPHLKNCTCEECMRNRKVDQGSEEKYDLGGDEQAKLVQMSEFFPNSDEMNKYFLEEAGGDVSRAIDNIYKYNEQSLHL